MIETGTSFLAASGTGSVLDAARASYYYKHNHDRAAAV